MVRRAATYEESLNEVAVSPDGSLIAVGLTGGGIRLWNIATGKPGVTLPSHGGRLPNWDGDNTGLALAFSPDGKTLATGGRDGLVKLWEMPEGKLIATLKWQIPDGPPRLVMSLAFSPDGTSLAVGGGFFDKEKAAAKDAETDAMFRLPVVWVWDVASRTGKLLSAPPRLTGKSIGDSGVDSVLYAPDGKTLAIGLTRESSAVILDVQTGEELPHLHFHPEAGWIGGMAFSPDGKTLAFGNDSSHVFLCDLGTGKMSHKLYGHLRHVSSVVYTHDGTVVSAAYDGTVRIWDAASGQLHSTFRCDAPIQRLLLLPGGKQLLVCTARDAQIWSLKAEPALAKFRAKDPKIAGVGGSGLSFNAAGSFLAEVGQDQAVRVFDVATRTMTRELVGHKGRSTAVAFGPADSDLLASGGDDHHVLLWHLRGANPLMPVVLTGHEGAITCLAVTPDGAIVVSGSLDGTVRLWDAHEGKCIYTFETGQGQIHCLAVTGDGRRLITGGIGGSLGVWDLTGHKLLQSPPVRVQGIGPIDQLAVTSDGRTVATIQSNVVAFHDLEANPPAPPRVLIGGASSVAFTPNGQTLAVGCIDRVARLYDVASGQYRGELPGHSHQVVALAFNRDATLLATASKGSLRWDRAGEVMLWAAPQPGGAK